MAAVNLSTTAAIKGGVGAVEIIGVLEVIKINVERQAFAQLRQAALQQQQQQSPSG